MSNKTVLNQDLIDRIDHAVTLAVSGIDALRAVAMMLALYWWQDEKSCTYFNIFVARIRQHRLPLNVDAIMSNIQAVCPMVVEGEKDAPKVFTKTMKKRVAKVADFKTLLANWDVFANAKPTPKTKTSLDLSKVALGLAKQWIKAVNNGYAPPDFGDFFTGFGNAMDDEKVNPEDLPDPVAAYLRKAHSSVLANLEAAEARCASLSSKVDAMETDHGKVQEARKAAEDAKQGAKLGAEMVKAAEAKAEDLAKKLADLEATLAARDRTIDGLNLALASRKLSKAEAALVAEAKAAAAEAKRRKAGELPEGETVPYGAMA